MKDGLIITALAYLKDEFCLKSILIQNFSTKSFKYYLTAKK